MEHYFLTGADSNARCECPMLRCRQHFDNARLMLSHLRLQECGRFEEGEFRCPTCPEIHRYPVANEKDCSWLREKTSTLQKVRNGAQRAKAKLTSPRQSRASPLPLSLDHSDKYPSDRNNAYTSTEEYPVSPDASVFDRFHAHDKYPAHITTGAWQKPSATAPVAHNNTPYGDGVCECSIFATLPDGLVLTLI